MDLKKEEISSHITFLEKWLNENDQEHFEKFYPEVKYQLQMYATPLLITRFNILEAGGRKKGWRLNRERKGDYACLRCGLKYIT